MYCLRRSLSKSSPVHFGSKNLFISNFSHKSVIKTTLVFQNFAKYTTGSCHTHSQRLYE